MAKGACFLLLLFTASAAKFDLKLTCHARDAKVEKSYPFQALSAIKDEKELLEVEISRKALQNMEVIRAIIKSRGKSRVECRKKGQSCIDNPMYPIFLCCSPYKCSNPQGGHCKDSSSQ
ncbi:hypothetical protein M9H77_17667 [Catharanthus roseus]|uniref:Uncharacterized protein n=1 Tax=Catharanthus roseus TaxID=4058 RepID=A0ACC0B592_CATRO|nr:hypothetical protein M9H77_17667 [Catharanthus roseus]